MTGAHNCHRMCVSEAEVIVDVIRKQIDRETDIQTDRQDRTDRPTETQPDSQKTDGIA